MPTYTVRDPRTGQVVRLTGASPPTEAELVDIFTGLSQTPSSPSPMDVARHVHPVAAATADVMIGAGKQLAERGIALGGYVRRQIPAVNQLDRLMTPRKVNVTPTNAWQRAGGIAEQVAEVIAPSRAITALATKTATLTAPRLASLLGRRTANVVPRAVIEGAGSAGLGALQGGDPVTAAALGATIPMIGGVVGRSGVRLREGAEEAIGRFFSPGASLSNRAGMKRIVETRTPEILSRSDEVLGGITGRSRTQALDIFTLNRQRVGAAVDEALEAAHAAQSINPQPLVSALDEAIAPYTTRRIVSAAELTAHPSLNRFAPHPIAAGQFEVIIPRDVRKVKQITGLKDLLAAHGESLTIRDLVGIRRAWDEVAYATPGATLETVRTKAEKWAKKMGGDAIRAVLDSETPELAAVNREFSFWKDLERVMEATVERTKSQTGGLRTTIAEAGGRALGAPSGIRAAFFVGKTAKTLQQVFQSPRWASLSANYKNQLAEAIQSGVGPRVASVVNRIAAVQGSQMIGSR